MISRLLRGATSWLTDSVEMLFPATCDICGRALVAGEEHLCLGCLMGMNRVEVDFFAKNKLYRRIVVPSVEIGCVGSLFWYNGHDGYAHLIHLAKYGNRPQMARWLGMQLGQMLAEEGVFEGVDVLAPVPMHWFKQVRRGYNQTIEIAKGVSRATGIPVSAKGLRAAHGHKSQTRMGAKERSVNVQGLFEAGRPEELLGRHVMLIDDVMTTGSTLRECVLTLRDEVPFIKVSVLTVSAVRF